MTETKHINGFKVQIEDIRDSFINFHNTVTISINDCPIISLSDVYADFKDDVIDLVHYHNKLPAGVIRMDLITEYINAGKRSGKSSDNLLDFLRETSSVLELEGRKLFWDKKGINWIVNQGNTVLYEDNQFDKALNKLRKGE